MSDQPPPTPNDSTPLWDLVIADMIESGRLTKADIPDDFEWLCAAIEKARVPR